ncbi:T9SS type A sorting domain-containing protein [bacterium]|nr:T9SS type A sorting domain-containing protein [bacterium]
MKKSTIAALVVFCLIAAVMYAQDLTVSVRPATITMEEAETCTLDVYIANVSGLGSFEFTLSFDTDIIHADASLPGDFLGSTGRTVLPLSPVIDNASNPGSVRHGAASLGSSPAGPSGSGILARIVFTAQSNGSAAVHFTSAQITDIAGAAITIDQVDDGRIDIGGNSLTGWNGQQSGTDKILNCVHAVSDENVWIVGQNIILKTIDGGGSWSDVTSGLGAVSFICLWAVDQNKAFASGFPSGATHSTLYRTTDGGGSWAAVCAEEGIWQNFVFMRTNTTGYLLGDAVGNTWVFMKTTNGGASWSTVATSPASNQSGEYTHGRIAYWWDGDMKIKFVSAAGWCYSSNDLGATWTSTAVLEQPVLSSLSFNATGSVGLVGMGTLGRIARSEDGGGSWYDITPPAGGTIRNIHYEHGRFWILIDTEMYSSEDNGDSWTLETTAAGNLRNVDFAPGTGEVCGWAVGNSGLILSCTTTDVDWKTSDGPVFPEDCLLSQNYPNPFNPNTTITYRVPEMSRVILGVYDILGHHLETLVDEIAPSGRYTVEWTAAGYKSGMYLCRLETGGKSELIKLLLMK